MPEHSPGSPYAEIDTTVAHEARVYDYWLGGKDNYAADRQLGEAIAGHIPSIRDMARANRAFLGRAVRFLVREAGIRQFLDIGTGIPTHGNVHEVAQAEAPECRVLYVDNDPIVLAHARALMSSSPEGRTRYLHADLADPSSILSHPELAETLDPDRPVAVMLVAILMYFRDADDPHGIVRRLLDAMPSGSYLALTHPTADFDADAMAGVVAASAHAGIRFVPRGRDEVAALLDGLEPVEPGITPVLGWRPDPGRLAPDERSAYYWAAVARKP